MVNSTLQHAIEFVRLNEMPFWILFKKEGFDREYSMVGKFFGEGENMEDLLAQSCDELAQKVQMFTNPGTTFKVEVMRNPKAAKTERLGPLYFLNGIEAGNATKAGLGNLPVAENFSLLQGLMDKKEQLVLMQANNLAEINRKEMELLLDRKDFEHQKSAFEREKAAWESEKKELEAKFNSHSEKVNNGVTMALGNVFSEFFSDTKAKTALGSIVNPPAKNANEVEHKPEPVPEPTPYEVEMAKLGDLVEDNFRTVSEVQKLQILVGQLVSGSLNLDEVLNHSQNGIHKEESE